MIRIDSLYDSSSESIGIVNRLPLLYTTQSRPERSIAHCIIIIIIIRGVFEGACEYFVDVLTWTKIRLKTLD